MNVRNVFCVTSREKILSAMSVVLFLCSCGYGKWQVADGPLMTRWGKEVTPENAHREYPRPQLAREDWLNLNGLWDYAIVANDPADKLAPKEFDGKILVPFPAESALSGVMKKVGVRKLLWYRRSVEIPAGWAGKRVILNFGGVDWDATVWVNGKEVGRHRGGYDPKSVRTPLSRRPTSPHLTAPFHRDTSA